MTNENRWLGSPRSAAAACGTAATLLGLLYMALAGAPPLYLAVNGLALLMGLAAVALVWTAGREGALPGGIVLAAGALLLATALFGFAVEGAARWVRVGGLSIQASLVVLPAVLVSFAQRRDGLATLGVVVAALALALQPDRAMAGVLTGALAVLALRRPEPRVLLALASATTGFAATLLRPDTLPAVPYVDRILYTSFDVGPVAGAAVAAGAVLLVLPALVGWWRDPAHRAVYAVFGAVWSGAVLAAALGNYPTPLVGYGGSAVLGYALSLSLIPPLPQRAAAAARSAAAITAPEDRGADLRLAVGGGPLST